MKTRLTYGLSLMFLLSSAVVLTIYLAWLLYPLEIGWLQLEEAAGLPSRTLQKNFGILMDYLTNPFNWRLEMPDFPSSADGLHHFEVVKKLFHLAQTAVLLTAPAAVSFFRQVLKTGQGWLFAKGFAWLALLPVLLALFAGLVGFSQFFVFFHQLLFWGDETWLFHPDRDPVILILPEIFFLHCFLLFFAVYELLTGGAAWILYRSGRQTAGRL